MLFLKFHHISVLMEETINALVTNIDGVYVDCTLGGSGHAGRVIERLSEKGRFIGIDQDPAAITVAKERLAGVKCKVDIINSNFKELETVLADLGVEKVDGVLFDLGVSSHQLDVAERGFSYMQDAPLDMRMNTEASLSAFEVVNTYNEEELTNLIYNYGEERWAKRIVKFIIEARANAPINTTGQLVDLIKKAIPVAARKEGGHPAKRTFQAIRIEVNNELGILKDTFECAVKHLNVGGRLCIITFHSLEDRIAKQTLQALAKPCICPPRLPVCVCNHKSEIKVIGKPVVATVGELDENPRARSAKLRVAEKL
ncbi:MAG: Ribosomal small subunit methyltransferase [Firmicutes bacterium]|jgi:16S rRNA (cytosine1402-N4)-methyltransferase|nr:Ribosomal small subunit methyltransferase [Bacillota bacterium]